MNWIGLDWNSLFGALDSCGSSKWAAGEDPGDLVGILDWLGLDWSCIGVGLDWIPIALDCDGFDMDWIAMDWIGLYWILCGLDLNGVRLHWIGLGMGWIGLDWGSFLELWMVLVAQMGCWGSSRGSFWCSAGSKTGSWMRTVTKATPEVYAMDLIWIGLQWIGLDYIGFCLDWI